MLLIAGSLLGGWILGLFGFDTLVINGMFELFGVTLSKVGYYFIFGMLGAIKSVLSFVGRPVPTFKFKSPTGKSK